MRFPANTVDYNDTEKLGQKLEGIKANLHVKRRSYSILGSSELAV
jgi:hypothetical protein